MNLVTLEGVGKQFSERKLLDGVDLLINEGDRIGLIGINGSGKTTLLRIIAGEEPADSGSVTVWGGVTIRYLSQQPDLDGSLTVLDHLFHSDEPAMRLLHDFEEASLRLQERPDDAVLQQRLIELTAEMDRTHGWEAEAQAKTILTRLGITEFDARLDQLSGGQRKRVALARVLINPSDLLIFDEPTNHIDAETIAWLEDYLLGMSGALLMVTHDRYFLDRVVNRIVELDRRKLISYPGNYSKYLELRTARHEQLAAAEAARQNRLRQELEWLRRGAQARSTRVVIPPTKSRVGIQPATPGHNAGQAAATAIKGSNTSQSRGGTSIGKPRRRLITSGRVTSKANHGDQRNIVRV